MGRSIKIIKITTPPFYSHYTGQPALASTSSQEPKNFVGAKFYWINNLDEENS